MPTFVLNDENVVNSYGFRVRNAGINFQRFDANPVMLDSHLNLTKAVMGKWINRRIEGALLKMDTEFDTEYDEAKRLSGQVDRGYVKGASPGLAISFDEECFERQPDGNWDLILSEFMEGTICGVPSNSGALVQLYDKSTGDLISEDQVKLSLQKLSAEKVNPNNPKMEKIILSTAAQAVLVGLNVTSADNVSEISNAIVKLHADKTAADAKVLDLQGKLDVQLKGAAKALADQAVLDGKITQDEHAELMADAIANLSLTAKLVAKMPGKVSLTGQVKNQDQGDAKIKTLDDFEKLSLKEQLAFRDEKPDAYNALFA